jgi:hypothetical protein
VKLDTWARWIIVAGIGVWSLVQLGMQARLIAVLTGNAERLGVDDYVVQVVSSLSPLELAGTIGNTLAYPASAVLLALRREAGILVYLIAFVLDIGSWLSYSMQAAYDQLPISAYDWLINTGLLVCLLGLVILRQRGHFRR